MSRKLPRPRRALIYLLALVALWQASTHAQYRLRLKSVTAANTTPEPGGTPPPGSFTYYVSTSGSDANSGTESQPFRTISHALSVLTPGQSACAQSGTYSERLINWPSGTSGNTITVAGCNSASRPVIQGAASVSERNFHIYQASYLTVKDLIVDAVNVNQPLGPRVEASHDILLENIEFKNAKVGDTTENSAMGLLIGASVGTVTNIIVRGCQVHDNGPTFANPFQHGIYVFNATNVTLEDNDIYANAGYGIHVYWGSGGPTSMNGITVRRNKAHGNGKWGILVGFSQDAFIYNNITYGNGLYSGGGGGIRIQYGGVGNARVYNNTNYGNTGTGIEIGDESSNAIVQNNISYNNSTNYLNAGAATTHTFNLDTGTNPLFTNAGANDFTLQGGSPAVDAGTDLSAYFTTDYAKTTRPVGGGWDQGAYESH